MKKLIVSVLLILMIALCFITTKEVYATDSTNQLEGQLTEKKDEAETTLERYKKSYGSEAYGVTAYILHLVRIYSIPFCFLGITISGIYQYVIGIRKLDVKEKGLKMMVTFVTLLVICQILPLAFTIVVKFGRG
jgi:Na+/melibiose symporter-like transporter